jgi:hypothetical protein
MRSASHEFKNAAGNSPFGRPAGYVLAREKQVFGNIQRLNPGPLPSTALTLCAIFSAYPPAPESVLINVPSKP